MLRPRLLLSGLAGALIAVGISFLFRPRYTATARSSIVNQRTMDASARLATFASELGIAGALAQNTDSPELFAAIAGGRQVARIALADTFCTGPARCVGVREAVRAPRDTSRAAVARQFKALARRLSVGVDARTGLLGFSVWADSPADAEGILRAVLRATSEVVITRRESQARNERISAEARFKELDRRRSIVEDSLTRFYEGNRAFENAPRLNFRERQLSRQLDFWQSLATSVARDAESARLDEVRDVPVMTIVERPFALPRKSRPRRSAFAVLGLCIGLALGIGRADWQRLGSFLFRREN
jgi:uncharacterized protein involved in exopolysaccharide biosynthesis